MPLQPAALELLTALVPVLAGWGRWYLFGAQAVVAYGVPRLSADVDVTIALVPDDPDRFARDMSADETSPVQGAPQGFGSQDSRLVPRSCFRL